MSVKHGEVVDFDRDEGVLVVYDEAEGGLVRLQAMTKSPELFDALEGMRNTWPEEAP